MLLSPQDSQEKNANPVKAEEAKLKAKYPGLGQKPGGSDFLMKRLQKGVGDRGLSATWSGNNDSWESGLCHGGRSDPPQQSHACR